MSYTDFLETKKRTVIQSGFDISPEQIKKDFPQIFLFQSFILSRALKAGKYAIFADCGLGKTFMQMVWAHYVSGHSQKPVLILAPLAVSGQTIKEGVKFGIEVEKYEFQHTKGIYITNYEQLENVKTSAFSGIVLDESSILKNFAGKNRTAIIEAFRTTPYKLACTATPSPNDPMELGNHAEFLDVCTRSEMLGEYFVNDASRSSKYRLKRHGVGEFYKWVAQWAVMLSKPGDLGFDDSGYDLPPLNFVEREIKTPKQDNGLLFNTESVSAANFNKELRITKVPRIEAVAEIVNNSDEEFIIWIRHNDEGKMLRDLIPDAVEVSGSDTPETKEKRLLGFSAGEFRVLITKQKIAQFGLNFQNCRNQIFAALDFSFEALYQAIRRSYRFGQDRAVNIFVVTTDTMRNVIQSIKRKEHEFKRMQAEMTAAICAYTEAPESEAREVPEVRGNGWLMQCGDCVQLIKQIPDESVDYSFQSPPFSSLYTYSNSPADMSNCRSHDEFYEHFSFMPAQYMRVLKPGRLVSFHCTQLTTGKGRDGFLSIIDFRGELIRAMQNAGFYFHAEVTIRKDPQLAAVRTKNIQLLHGQTKKDSSINRPGLADYIITFRKPGENAEPINFGGEGLNFEYWTKIAEPTWMDISESDTLRTRKEDGDERHMTPTQLETIHRCILLWSNPGDLVVSTFSGHGSEGYQAILDGRRFHGMELKKFYFDLSIPNMRTAEQLSMQKSLI